jgi:hypothetical protein
MESNANLTVFDGKAYLFTYKADPEKYSTYLQTIQDMIKLFKIVK